MRTLAVLWAVASWVFAVLLLTWWVRGGGFDLSHQGWGGLVYLLAVLALPGLYLGARVLRDTDARTRPRSRAVGVFALVSAELLFLGVLGAAQWILPGVYSEW